MFLSSDVFAHLHVHMFEYFVRKHAVVYYHAQSDSVFSKLSYSQEGSGIVWSPRTNYGVNRNQPVFLSSAIAF
jgi:hypothetical protein